MKFEHRVFTVFAVLLTAFGSLMWFVGGPSAWPLLIGFYAGAFIEPWVVGRTRRNPQDGAKAADIVRALRYAEHLLTGYSITGEGPEQMGERIVALDRIRTAIRRMEEGVPDTPRGHTTPKTRADTEAGYRTERHAAWSPQWPAGGLAQDVLLAGSAKVFPSVAEAAAGLAKAPWPDDRAPREVLYPAGTINLEGFFGDRSTLETRQFNVVDLSSDNGELPRGVSA